MNFTSSVLFLFAGIGVINGFIMGAYLLIQKRNSLNDLFFGGLLIALSLRIGKSVWVYFDPDLDKLVLQLGLSACLFIGPFFFLFIKSHFKPQKADGKNGLLLLGLLLLSIITIGIIWPYRLYPGAWNTYIVKGIYTVWLLFVCGGIARAGILFRKMLGKGEKLNSEERYLFAIITSILFITLTYQFALFIKGFTYIWGSLIFSFSFYYLLWRALKHNTSIAPASPKAELTPLENGQELLRKIDKVMATNKPYMNPRLKLEDLAQLSGIQRNLLSRVLNEVYKDGFAHYVNEYRVREAQRLIQSRDDLTFEGIGYESGFNSKSSFYSTFKKITSFTPLQFKKTILSK